MAEVKPAPANVMLKVTLLAPALTLGLSEMGCWAREAESAKSANWCQVEVPEMREGET